MKIIYIKVKLDTEEKWIKCILHHNNFLDLNSIAKSLNQFYINTYPDKVFFDVPNILYKEITPLEYINLHPSSILVELTTKDRECNIEAHFYSQKDLQKYLIDWIRGNENVRNY